MATTIIANNPPYTFGVMTNRLISGIISANTTMARLNEAVATASAGYAGTPGTQFEISTLGGTLPVNLFGVQADPDDPGQRGSDYSYAIGELNTAWQAFWEAARPYIEQLDNGNSNL
jgi:hypothetical protein